MRRETLRSRTGKYVKRTVGATVADAAETCTDRLARFFASAEPVRIPVQVSVLRPGSTRLSEATVVEYRAEGHAIFVSSLPLEFDDRVRMEHAGTDTASVLAAADAAVTAVQYHEGKKAVAVRFLKGPCPWMMKP